MRIAQRIARGWVRTTVAGMGASALLAGGQVAAAAPVEDVPCKVNALVAAMDTAITGQELSLATACVYHLTQALPAVTQDLTIDGNNAALERSYDPGTPAFTILTVTNGTLTVNGLEFRNGDNAVTLTGGLAAITAKAASALGGGLQQGG
jgi:hypothetical protein